MTKKKVLTEGEELDKGGRPTDYKKEYNDLAHNYCLLGADDKTLGKYFEVDERTINRWKKDYPKFCQSIKEGKDIADANVGKSLYERACGYSHEDVHISNYQGKIIKTELIKHYPPDATSAIFWLKNRQKDNWRDKTDHGVHHSGSVSVNNLEKGRMRALEREKPEE